MESTANFAKFHCWGWPACELAPVLSFSLCSSTSCLTWTCILHPRGSLMVPSNHSLSESSWKMGQTRIHLLRNYSQKGWGFGWSYYFIFYFSHDVERLKKKLKTLKSQDPFFNDCFWKTRNTNLQGISYLVSNSLYLRVREAPELHEGSVDGELASRLRFFFITTLENDD